MKSKSIIIYLLLPLLLSCGAWKKNQEDKAEESPEVSEAGVPRFDADSAYSYLAAQVAFGPRVPNSEAHRQAADWLVAELKRHGAEVIEQKADLKAFDGTVLKARNIFGQYNPEASDRTLLLAHYDCRPWADKDPDPAKRSQPVDGANDGASGTAVLLETARNLALSNPGKGIDILFLDAEDWGSEGDDDSWALGARYFAQNPVKPGYRPARAILLDMVGGRGAKFYIEYFSQQAAPGLVEEVWNCAAEAGYGHVFPKQYGGAVTDDHAELIKAGIPAIDIIEFDPQHGFNETWHTTADNLSNIDRTSLEAVGNTIFRYIWEF